MRNLNRRHPQQRGFTLIEIMVVVVIVSILMAIALPAYRDHIIRGKRAAAKGEMLDIANRQQQLLLSDRAYAASTDTVWTANGYALPGDVSDNYGYAITVSGGPPPSFLITFTPTGVQASDGALTLNSEGVKLPADKWVR